MQIAKFLDSTGSIQLGVVQENVVRVLETDGQASATYLTRLLASDSPEIAITAKLSHTTIPLESLHLLAPMDLQEVWGAGVTYERSKVARVEESEQGGSFYDLVYTADRPELFFKATPSRVVGPSGKIRVRGDSKWSVPEPELALVLDSTMRLVGYTVGNDVSSRDIEGRNPLYLPQAKMYAGSCALGPWITLATAMLPASQIGIEITIDRAGSQVFEGATSIARMARTFADLIDWLGRENVFPDGVILLTGTGVVPPDEFTLAEGDVVRITIDGIGTLTNIVSGGVA